MDSVSFSSTDLMNFSVAAVDSRNSCRTSRPYAEQHVNIQVVPYTYGTVTLTTYGVRQKRLAVSFNISTTVAIDAFRAVFEVFTVVCNIAFGSQIMLIVGLLL